MNNMVTWNRKSNSECQVCNKRFYRRPQAMLNNKTCCCSRECSALLRAQWMSGSGNHQFGLKGSLNSSFKLDVRLSTFGYILLRCTNHPLRNVDNFIFAHRLLVEEDLKKNDSGSEYLIDVDGSLVLSPEAIVHHIDSNKINNSLGNLEVMTRGDHTAMHSKDFEFIRNNDGTFKTVRPTKSGGKLTRKHKFDAGMDVSSSEDITIFPNDKKLVSTELHISIPKNHVGLLWSRSGLSVNHSVEVGAGCIDSGYTGEVKVLLYNNGLDPFEIKTGDRVAQLLTIPVNLSDYNDSEDLIETDRGSSGFGSSGVS